PKTHNRTPITASPILTSLPMLLPFQKGDGGSALDYPPNMQGEQGSRRRQRGLVLSVVEPLRQRPVGAQFKKGAVGKELGGHRRILSPGRAVSCRQTLFFALDRQQVDGEDRAEHHAGVKQAADQDAKAEH